MEQIKKMSSAVEKEVNIISSLSESILNNLSIEEA